MATVDKSVSRSSSGKLREQAYSSFTRHLLASELRPGQFISQRELVKLTGMPLGAIRELVPRLEAEGLISTIPQRGMQIAPIDYNLVRDAYQFRLFLEKEAIAAFVQNASDEEISRIKAAHQEVLERVEDEGQSPALVAHAQELDWGFHDLLIDGLKNEIISKAYRVNSIKIRLIRQELTRINGLVKPVMEEHMRIICAIEDRDAGEAVGRLSGHIKHSQQRALGLAPAEPPK